MLDLLRRMMSLNKDMKFDLDAKDQLTNLTACMQEVAKLRLRASAAPIETAIINLSEFINCSEEIQKRMLTMAKKSSYVQFINSEETKYTPKQELEARRLFEKDRLVATEVLRVGKDLRFLPGSLQFHSDPTKKFKYQYVTSKALSVDSKKAAAISQNLTAAGIKVKRTAEPNPFGQFQLPSAAAVRVQEATNAEQLSL